MLSKTLSSIFLLSSLVTALPTQIIKRQNDEPTDQNWCNYSDSGSYNWGVHIFDPNHLSNYGTGSSTFGGGLLDNLRGRCGVITDWRTNNDESAPDLYAYFTTSIFCKPEDVSAAIQAANGLGIQLACGLKTASPAFDGLPQPGDGIGDGGVPTDDPQQFPPDGVPVSGGTSDSGATDPASFAGRRAV